MNEKAEIEAAKHTAFMLECANRVETVLADPFVGRAFPFVKRRDVPDSRQTRLCRILSNSGLPLTASTPRTWLVVPEGEPLILRGRKFYPGQPIPPKWISSFSTEELALFGERTGSAYFWRFDPLWTPLFCPPSYSDCRCSPLPVSLEGAAKAGVIVALRWLETGVKPPDNELCVPRPPVRLSRKWLAYRKSQEKPATQS